MKISAGVNIAPQVEPSHLAVQGRSLVTTHNRNFKTEHSNPSQGDAGPIGWHRCQWLAMRVKEALL